MAKKKAIKRTMNKKKDECCMDKKKHGMHAHCCKGAGYCLGFLGAAAYNISTTTGFWNGVWGVIKALVWPAFMVFELFRFLGQ
ncbi:hypothetical protein ACFL3V_00430 [Nanoarchaeota archaeon]